MSTQRTPRSDKELWHGLATGGAVASGPVSDLDFAAWLDGRLSETAAARIEAAVADDPEMRRAALDVADILGKPLPAAPARLEVRARALVGFEAERQGDRAARASLIDWLFAGNRRFAMQRVVTITAAAVIAVSGFMLGGGLGESLAQERYVARTGSTIDASGSNEFTDFLVSDGI
jgi:anti-sigma factor RsiW